MSCDYTKLCYLEETKRLFREKIDPSGTKITDETPFRDYVGMVTGMPAGNVTLISSVSKSVNGNATVSEI